jgi:hypothetical protein
MRHPVRQLQQALDEALIDFHRRCGRQIAASTASSKIVIASRRLKPFIRRKVRLA